MSFHTDWISPRTGDVVATIDIAVSPERVFRALIDPEELAAWWVGLGAGASRGTSAPKWRVDARPRGRWSVATSDAAGSETTVSGEYRVVDPPRVLEFTWEASWDGFRTATVRCELEPVMVDGAAGTRLRVFHTLARGAVAYGGVARPAFNWNDALASLAHYVAGRPLRPIFVARPFGRDIIA